MTPFEAYQKFIAIKLHFTTDSYDYFKYKGVISNLKPSSLDVRKDKYFFYKLSKKEDLEFFLASNFFHKKKVWVGKLFGHEAEDVYKAAVKRIQSLEYNLKTDLSQFSSYEEALNSTDGQYPKLLTKYNQGEVQPETLIVLNEVYRVFDYWSEVIGDSLIWPETKRNLLNYSGFISFDSDKYKLILNSIYSE